jgi:putative nucleotidyltransferase with HDIG domain
MGFVLSGAKTGSAMPDQKYMSIPLSALQQGSTTDFDLYIRNGKDGKPLLYRKAGLSFSEEAYTRLLDRNISTIWVCMSDQDCYRRYVEEHIGQILADQSIPLQQRSKVLYGSAQEMVKEILRDPRAGGVLKRSARMVESMVAFMYRESKSFQHLMGVTSYDYYTYTHSVDVFVYSIALAQKLGWNEQDVFSLGQGAVLHDVGKSRISPEILNWNGPLSDEQWVIMRQHPAHGEEILREQGETSEGVLDVVRHHHEKLTGKGYPDGLPAEAITPAARIAAIADIFSALTTNRPYKKAMGTFEALKLMKDRMEEELDARYFQVFVQLLATPGKGPGAK